MDSSSIAVGYSVCLVRSSTPTPTSCSGMSRQVVRLKQVSLVRVACKRPLQRDMAMQESQTAAAEHVFLSLTSEFPIR